MTASTLTSWSGAQIAHSIAPKPLAGHPFVFSSPRWTRMSSGASRSSGNSGARSRPMVIVPHYQPLVSLDGNRIIGFEALARWENEDLGFVPPTYLFPSRKKPASSMCSGISFCAAHVLMPTRGLRLSSSPSMSRPFNCAIRRSDCAFYRSSGKPGSARAAWRLKSPRARLWKISGSRRP